jgi:Na+/melibiose symporter-like transporter
LIPGRIRGRFIGRLERWKLAGEAAAMLTSGLSVWGWHAMHPDLPGWRAYIMPATVGACLMMAAVVPLVAIPAVASGRLAGRGTTLRSLLGPFRDTRFLRLLLFGCWFSLSNGLTQSAQYPFTKNVLMFSLFALLAMQTGMKVGQLSLSPRLGRLADRRGNRSVMAVCLLLTAQGPLFYFLARPEQPWWIAGAWTVWIAYAGLNVCLPNLMLKLSPGESNTPHIATYYAVTGLCYAANTLLGGWLSDHFRERTFTLFGLGTLDYYQWLFLLGWLARNFGLVLLLLVVVEPMAAHRRPVPTR